MKSLYRVYVHFVWATWDRMPLIDAGIERRLYRFIEGICKDHECAVLALGGMPDHVHLLVKLSAKISMADLMEFVKGGSSRFVSEELRAGEWFKWQRGYGAFSVSASHKGRVVAYIENQKQHHAAGDVWAQAETIHEDEPEFAVVQAAPTGSGAGTRAR